MSKSSSRLKLFIASILAFITIAFSGVAHAQIVAFGASNVSGANLSAADTFPAQLQSMLRAKGYDVTVTNAGVYGNTTAQMRSRVDSDIPSGTTIVILDMSGGFYNNYLRGISPDQGRADMAAIMARLRARGIKIIQESGQKVPLSDKQQDGIHLTAAGHQRVASYLLPLVVRALGRPR